MKQLFKPLSILLLVIISALWTSASAVEIDGIYYYLEGNTATVTNKLQSTYGGSSASYFNAYSGAITIPSTVTYGDKTYTVTRIQEFAFRNCPDLKTVSIPSTITSIGTSNPIGIYDCFYGCTSFKAFIVSADNPNYSAVGGILFDKDKTILLRCPEGKTGEYTIPTTVKTIYYYAFYDCSNITSVSLPNGLTSIEQYAFYNCSSLTNINIPTSLTELSLGAFSGCSSLNSEINIPTGIKTIPSEAFNGCSALPSVIISEGVENIGSNAFRRSSTSFNYKSTWKLLLLRL